MAVEPTAAVVVLLHGSRSPEATAEALALVDLVARNLPGRTVRPAFLSLGTPDLASVLNALAGTGAGRITILPVFLFRGAHVSHDIDAMVAAAVARHPALRVAVAPHLGPCSELADLLLRRLEATEATAPS